MVQYTSHRSKHRLSLAKSACLQTCFARRRLKQDESLAVRLDANELHRFGQQNPSFLSTLMGQLGKRFETFNKASAFILMRWERLERDEFDLAFSMI